MKYLFLFFILFAGNLRAQSVFEANIDWSNPSFIAGSNLPTIFQRYYLLGDYDSMLELTSAKTRMEFGDQKLRLFYERMMFGYNFIIKNKIIEKDGTQCLFGEAIINATKTSVKFRCVVEKGKSKMFINTINLLKSFPQNQN